jgi:DNA-binding response OmpR family regulator
MIKVLVVDDEPTIATLLADIIEDYGYEVTIAFDGRQGYELAKSGVFRLVISDIMMPHVSGQELCSRIKSEPKASHTQVVLMSAVSHLAHLGSSCAADAFILKPFDISVITQIIERFLVTPNITPPSITLPTIENRIYYEH